jgi:hypothetical protein
MLTHPSAIRPPSIALTFDVAIPHPEICLIVTTTRIMVSHRKLNRKFLVKILFMVMSSFTLVESFLIQPPQRHRRLESLFMQKRRNVCIPLLDILDSEYADKFVTPLPSAHLPLELSSLNLYGMQLERPVHKMLIDEAIQGGDVGGAKERAYGYIVKRKSDDSLVGAVGCAADVLINAIPNDADFSRSDVGDDVPITILSRGSYRFVVKEVVKTFPYPVGIVDELMDQAPVQVERVKKDEEEEDDDDEEDDGDDEDDDVYQDLDSSELVRQTMVGLHTLIHQKLDDQNQNLSPLEKSILEDTGLPLAEHQQSQAEEMAAIFEVFQSSLIDIAPMPIDRYYAIGMLAAEMVNVDNRIRQDILTMTDGLARLRLVLREIESAVDMNRAKKVASTITDELDEDQKELKVRFGDGIILCILCVSFMTQTKLSLIIGWRTATPFMGQIHYRWDKARIFLERTRGMV